MASEDVTGLANELNDFFTSVGSMTAQKASDLALHHGLNVNLDVPTPFHVSSNVSPELFEPHQVTENQVEMVIRRLPSNKAPGMDKTSSRILKDSLPCTLTIIKKGPGRTGQIFIYFAKKSVTSSVRQVRPVIF